MFIMQGKTSFLSIMLIYPFLPIWQGQFWFHLWSTWSYSRPETNFLFSPNLYKSGYNGYLTTDNLVYTFYLLTLLAYLSWESFISFSLTEKVFHTFFKFNNKKGLNLSDLFGNLSNQLLSARYLFSNILHSSIILIFCC